MGEFFNIIDNENTALIPDGEKELRQELFELLAQLPDLGDSEDIDLYLDESDPDNIIHNPERIQEQKDIVLQIKTLEKNRLPEIYKDTDYTSPVGFQTHHKQIHGLSCVIASTLNTMEALGIRPEDMKEEDVANAFGETGKDKMIDISKAKSYLLHEKNNQGQPEFVVKDIQTTTDLIDTLREGNVTMLAKPGHEILISGMSIKQGKITFMINDPQFTEVQKYDLDTVIDLIDPRQNSNTFSIKKSEQNNHDAVDIKFDKTNENNIDIKLN